MCFNVLCLMMLLHLGDIVDQAGSAHAMVSYFWESTSKVSLRMTLLCRPASLERCSSCMSPGWLLVRGNIPQHPWPQGQVLDSSGTTPVAQSPPEFLPLDRHRETQRLFLPLPLLLMKTPAKALGHEFPSFLLPLSWPLLIMLLRDGERGMLCCSRHKNDNYVR